MERQHARTLADGYCWGREDASGIPTRHHGMLFADAFADGWQAYNDEQRDHMTSVKSAYDTWQATGGLTIFYNETPLELSRTLAWARTWNQDPTGYVGHKALWASNLMARYRTLTRD